MQNILNFLKTHFVGVSVMVTEIINEALVNAKKYVAPRTTMSTFSVALNESHSP